MTNFDAGGGRSDHHSVPLAGAPEVAAPSSLHQYVGTIRRRWRWIALGVLVGLLAGVLSAVLQKDVRDPTTYFKATHTLISTGQGGSGTASSLPQVAFLIRSADVTNAVAEQVGVPPSTITDQVTAIAQTNVDAIDVVAISTDPDMAVRMADVAAQVLTDYVGADRTAQYDQQKAALTTRLDDLSTQRTQVGGQLLAEPDNQQIRQNFNELTDQYTAAQEELRALAEPTGGFDTVQSATPVQINGGAYNRRLQANRNGRGSDPFGTLGDTSAINDETDLSSTAPVSKSTRVAVGLAAGLVLGLITAFVVETWDDRIRRSERAEGVTGLPVIAEVPGLSRSQRSAEFAAAADAPGSRIAERYRALRTTLLFVLHQTVQDASPGDDVPARPPVVLVTSPSAGEGKTTTVANLAAALGDSGARTLVVDCDYRKPAVARHLDPVPDLERLDAPALTRLQGVSFIPAPRLSNPTGTPPDETGSGGVVPARLAFTRTSEVIDVLRSRIERWRDEFDIVLLDTPPMLMTNDAIDLLPAADAVVLVLRAGQTKVARAERASNLLRRFDASVLGLVLNDCSSRDTDDAYGYGYGYYGDDGGAAGRGRRSPKRSTAPVTPVPAEVLTDIDPGSPLAAEAGAGAGDATDAGDPLSRPDAQGTTQRAEDADAPARPTPVTE